MLEKLTIKEVNFGERFLVGGPHSEKLKADSDSVVGREKREDSTSLPFDYRWEICCASSSQLWGSWTRRNCVADEEVSHPTLSSHIFWQNPIKEGDMLFIRFLLVTLKSPTNIPTKMWGGMLQQDYSIACRKAGFSLPHCFPVASQPRWDHPHASPYPTYWLSLLFASYCGLRRKFLGSWPLKWVIW